MDKNNLPNNIEELKKLLIKTVEEKDQTIQEKNQIIQQQNKEINNKTQEIEQKKQQIESLSEVINWLRRKKFAPSSESSNQLQLFNELEEIVEDDKDAETEDVSYKRKKRGCRKPLPESLPREEIKHDIPESEKEGMKCIGQEVSEKLVIIPAKVYVEQHVRLKYAPISADSGLKMKIAEMPPQLLPKTMASPSVIAYIITSKFVDALPLYRQEAIFRRIQADLTRQTMAKWLIKVSEKLMPLYNLLQEKLLSCNYLQLDETTVQVLKEEGKKATTKSYMWLRLRPGDNPIVLYDYSPNRSKENPIRLLEGFQGTIQVDGYDGYSKACELYNLKRLGCWDHCRRKFFDAAKVSKKKGLGKKGLKIIDKLYKVEKKIENKENLTLELKQAMREELSRPILKEFRDFLDEYIGKVVPSSLAGQAIKYANNEWKYLIGFMDSPEYNISNILIENAVRPFAIGRRNWLFSASVDGANASAMYYSLIETAKLNGLEPFDYLSKMLEKLPLAETVDDFEKLLPLKDCFQV